MELTIVRPSWWTRLLRRPTSSLGAFGAVAVLSLGSLVPALQQCTPPSQQQQVIDITNQRRAERSMASVQVSSQLSQAAQNHSQDQARNNRMSHSGSNGSDPGGRIAATGYSACGWAENVAAGQGNAEQVMSAWMNSSGHRANILGSYREIGVGLAYSSNGTPYWTMVLATRC